MASFLFSKCLINQLRYLLSNKRFLENFTSKITKVQDAIDNRIEQALDLVKCHLMNEVLSEVEELKEKIIRLEHTISQQQVELAKTHTEFNREVGKLQTENEFLRNHVSPEVINNLPNLKIPNTVHFLP